MVYTKKDSQSERKSQVGYQHEAPHVLTKGMENLVLLTEAESLDKATVAVDVLLLKILEEGATLAYEHCKATGSLVVLMVLLEVLCEMLDTISEKSHLAFRRTSVGC